MFFHGLAAFRGGKKPLDIIRKADNILGNEIACSDKPIGTIGLLVSGQVKAAFTHDCWSFIENGERKASTIDFVDIGSREFYNLKNDEIQINEFVVKASEFKETLTEHISLEFNYRYSEIFLIPDSVNAIWVKETASNLEKKVARILSKQFGIITITTSDDSNSLNYI